MSHANATLTSAGRLRLARLVVDKGWSYARAAERFSVSATTARRWAGRYREDGPAGMVDASSRPHRSPTRTPAPVVRRVVHLRWKHRLGPVQIAEQTGLAPRRSTPYWSGAGSIDSPMSTEPPANPCDGTNTTTPAR